MELRELIASIIFEHLSAQVLSENTQLIDAILDKIHKSGQNSLSYDERKYLKQHNAGRVNPNLEQWLLDDNDLTFDDYGNKLLYDEFQEDEDIFHNHEKLKRVLTKHLGTPTTNNADWGGGYAWPLKSNDGFSGTFFYLGDDELVMLNRERKGDHYRDETLSDITTTKELYDSLVQLTKKEGLNEQQTSEKHLSTLKKELASAAQKVYDEWEQDEDGYCDWLGVGGICQDIADAMASVLTNHGIECSTVSAHSGEQHVYVVAQIEDGVYNVDISPYLYETGGGYCWKKIPDVKFDESYIEIYKLSSDPNDFEDYIEDV
jgi:hypothetical protein